MKRVFEGLCYAVGLLVLTLFLLHYARVDDRVLLVARIAFASAILSALFHLYVEWKRLELIKRLKAMDRLDESVHPPDNQPRPGTLVQFLVILLLSSKRRDEVIQDLLDWYPGWARDHGRFSANLLCFARISSAAIYELLDLLYRIGEVVGKFRGAK